jgi:hypothetical protein
VGWEWYTSTADGFAVLLPAGVPRKEVKPKAMAAGGSQSQILSQGREEEFGVGTVTLPAGGAAVKSADELFTRSLQGFLDATPGGRVTSQRDISLGKYPGRHIETVDRVGKGAVIRLYLAGPHFYILAAGGNGFTGANLRVQTFLNSFRLLGN